MTKIEPRAAAPYHTYRYFPGNGASPITIGAMSDAEALTEAKRSLSDGSEPVKANLQVLSGLSWIDAFPMDATPHPKGAA